MSLIDFRLPSLGADMESAVLTEWLKKPGEAIRHGDPIATVETEKGLIDIECFDNGSIAEIIVQPGTRVPVGTPLARLTIEAAAAPIPARTVAPAAPAPIGEPAAGTPVPPRPPPTPKAGAPQHVRISPAARRRAQELGISLEVLAHADGGAILHIADVERIAARTQPAAPLPAAGPPTPASSRAEDVPQATAATADARSPMRIAIGNAMARAKREIPHYYLGQSVDFSRAQRWLAEYNGRVPVKDSLIDAVLIVKATALAASRIEGFNGHFQDGRFTPSRAVHVGAAIAIRGGGLVAPALLDADRKTLPALMQEFSALVTRVRAGHMRSGEFSAATITVTSLGAEGADVLYPIINPPQVAIVGTGAIRERPWVDGGGLFVRPVLELTLGADHRVTDGRAGSRFLRAIADQLARPEEL